MRAKDIRLTAILAAFIFLGFMAGIRVTKTAGLPNISSVVKPFSVNSADTVSVTALKQMLKNKNFTLINVHTPYAGEIPQTDTFIPYDQIVANSSLLPKNKNAPLILYCETGRMSLEALTTVRKLGYTNVRHLAGGMQAWKKEGESWLDLSTLGDEVIPVSGAELPVSWGSLGEKLVSLGVIDMNKFKRAVKLTPEQEKILTSETSNKIKIDRTNVSFVVDLLWAFGLAQKSVVYDQGPMGTTEKKDVANFASTGGWTLASGDAMNYYNRFDLLNLTKAEQQKVAEISKNVYRPCCGNPTWFPDCNHGMAALAMIELLVKNKVDEATIYKKLLAFNSYWFSDTYLTTATYFARRGIKWKDVDAKKLMGLEFSSGQGASSIAKKVGPLPWRPQSGTSCGA